MSVIMVADFYSTHMKALYSSLIVQHRIADLRHLQVDVREVDLCPLNMRPFHEMNPCLSQQFCYPFPKNRVVPFCSLAKLKLVNILLVALCIIDSTLDREGENCVII